MHFGACVCVCVCVRARVMFMREFVCACVLLYVCNHACVMTLLAGQAVYSSSNPTQCSDSSPEFSGKVAVIDRGTCAFADKVCRAQLQGAVAAIVVNNADGGEAFTMGGSSMCTNPQQHNRISLMSAR